MALDRSGRFQLTFTCEQKSDPKKLKNELNPITNATTYFYPAYSLLVSPDLFL